MIPSYNRTASPPHQLPRVIPYALHGQLQRCSREGDARIHPTRGQTRAGEESLFKEPDEHENQDEQEATAETQNPEPDDELLHLSNKTKATLIKKVINCQWSVAVL